MRRDEIDDREATIVDCLKSRCRQRIYKAAQEATNESVQGSAVLGILHQRFLEEYDAALFERDVLIGAWRALFDKERAAHALDMGV